MKALRAARGWSARELGDRLEAAGYGLNAAAVTNVEQGRRHLALDEWVAVADVLGEPPMAMLIPPEGETVHLPDGTELNARQLASWVTGQSDLEIDRDSEDAVHRIAREMAFQLYYAAATAATSAYRAVEHWRLESWAGPAQAELTSGLVRDSIRASIQAAMTAKGKGARFDPLPPQVVEAARELEMDVPDVLIGSES
jgi:transcriptional regulator with XRE-family HTH domain